ncbi:hypothetical protein D3C79_654400 [compost metagenome]
MVVALQDEVAPVRGAIEAEQPGGVGLLMHECFLAVLPGPQLPGAQGVALVGEGVEGTAIQAPEQIAGAVRQGGERLVTLQIQHGDAVIPIAAAVFGQRQPAPVGVQGPAGELVVAAAWLARGQPLAGGGPLIGPLPQAAVRLHAPLAARLVQPLLGHGFAPPPGLPLGLQLPC